MADMSTDRPHRIVVGFDGSDSAHRALERAAALAGYGSTLTVVSVATGDGGANALTAARDSLVARLVPATYLQPVGDPAEELVAAAREVGADVVVVGRRHGNPLGSVSAEVVRHAPCDVLVVR